MYKVFLVEDEIIVRERIRENVDWEGNGYILVGEASDGEKALPLIEEIKPDILITDIRMPFINGLELGRIVRKNMPWIKIIIISGHDEFSYAREAITVNVTEYLLKPICSKDLINALNNVALQIESERMKKQDYEIINEKLKSSMRIMQERFLSDLATGIIPSADAIEKASYFGVDIISKYYAAGIIILEAKPQATAQMAYIEYLKAETIINEMLCENKDIVKFSKNLRKIVLVFKSDNKDEIESNCYMLAQSIKYEVERNTSCNLTISIGSIRERIQGIAESIMDAETAMNFNYIFGKNKIIGIKDMDLLHINGKSLLKLDENMLIDYLRRGDGLDVHEITSNYVNEIEKQGLSSFLYAHMFISITLTVVRFIEELGGETENILPELNSLEKIIVGIDTVDKFKDYVEKILTDAFNFRESKREDKYGDIIKKAKKYINKNYSESNTSLNSVAAFVNVSPSHFSTIFSQETGITFIEYLTDVRIKKAKEFLKSTSLRSVEIAFKVGYNDSHYFSHVFKKAAGCSPTDFRLNEKTGLN